MTSANVRVLTAILGLVTANFAHGSDAKRFWCGSRDFPNEQRALQLATFSGPAGETLPIYFDGETCPSEPASCRQQAHAMPGEELIVNHVENGWACAWYRGPKSEAAGWVRVDKLAFQHVEQGEGMARWIGTWSFYENVIVISGKDDYSLRIDGRATWVGPIVNGERVTHAGAIEGDLRPTANHTHYSDKDDDCTADLSQIGRYLIVTDKGHCGGMNVSFNGVYVRR
jgi:hypothetical protein